ncbi:MAG TPA: MFS transporter [Solirubrobacterales bacterium]|nr:MFS transporter [Solirubrobacterales bacterium]
MRRTFIALAAGIALADASIVTLGLPSILIELDSTVEGVALVLGVYTAVLAVALLPAVWLCRRFGNARVGAAGFALFLAASLGCGASDSLGLLLVLRGIQALGGAAGLVAAFALLDGGRPGPGRRMWVAASVFGIAVGPALGGALTQAFSWRAIFLAQAPIVLPGLLVAWQAARTEPVDVGPREATRASSPLPWRPAIALGLISASLTAVVFLVVLLLVSGWSIEPLTAALAVSVLPVAAIASSRLPGNPETRAVAGCLMVGGGVGCLALLPGASAWWTVVPQVLAGAGMGMALPALSGELIPERTRQDAAKLLSIRHAGIAVALAALAPLISSNLTSTIDTAREQGTAAVLDAKLPPEDKIEIAPDLFGGLNTDDPRGELQRSIEEARAGLNGEEATELGHLGDRLDDVVTGAVRSAFRTTFIVTSALALLAALILLTGAPRAAAALVRPAVLAAAIAAVAAAGGYGIAYANSTRETVQIGDPCEDRQLPDVGGISGALQDISLSALDRAACEFGSSREELLLALFDDRLQRKFEDEHGVNPRSALSLGPALLGL